MRLRFAIPLVVCLISVAILSGPSLSGGHNHAKAEHLSTYVWRIHGGWFGGFSGIELSEDGSDVTMVSDRGIFVKAQVFREADSITGLRNVTTFRMLNHSGQVASNKSHRDAEGLVVMPDRSLMVSFEGEHRVARFQKAGAKEQPAPRVKEFRQMPLNGGLEALAIDSEGTLYTVAEHPIGPEHEARIYTFDGKAWHVTFVVPRDKKFQPVGADFGPDGRFYLLERGFNGIGFRTRVRSFDFRKSGGYDEKLLFRRGIGAHDNLEGLSVWRDPEGRIRLTMISDDNFRLVQRTEIVEYVLQQ